MAFGGGTVRTEGSKHKAGMEISGVAAGCSSRQIAVMVSAWLLWRGSCWGQRIEL